MTTDAPTAPALERVLDVRPTGDAGTGRFRGAAAADVSARTFGGHVMVQALLAAGRTVPGDEARRPSSLHCVMLRPGDAAADLDLEVEAVRDGRAFSTRRVEVTQAGRTIAQVSTQWHVAEDCSMTLDEVVEPPPRPEAHALPYRAPGVATSAFDLRWADDAPGRVLWFRLRDRGPDDPVVHAALALYLSDLWLADTALRRMGRRFDEPGVRASTLEHGIWWHRPVSLDRWVWLRSTTAAAQQGRALVTAELRSDDGAALASVVQAVSLRDRPAPTPNSSERARSAP